ncbi:hypothetical protein [Rhodobacter lacus]|uniref:Uncharacterized protein n=1 Tax=Rhodobacter lacus TaxID=1641972 RepID=A0ABW5AAU2_9RHOB
MSDHPVFLADILGYQVDVFPFAADAIRRCPYRHDFSALELCRLVEMAAHSKYIDVATLDRVEGRNLWWLTSDAIKEIRKVTFWMDRIAQVRDVMSEPVNRGRLAQLHDIGPDPLCDAARRLSGRWLRSDELLPLPLDACENDRCSCHYRTSSRREAARNHPDWPLPNDDFATNIGDDRETFSH